MNKPYSFLQYSCCLPYFSGEVDVKLMVRAAANKGMYFTFFIMKLPYQFDAFS